MFIPSGAVQSAEDESTKHGQKLFHLYTNNPAAYQSTIEEDMPAPVGLILLKETHTSIQLENKSKPPEEFNATGLSNTTVEHVDAHLQDSVLVPGKITDLFFMAKVGDDSILQTDNGWLYGGMDLNGKITTLTSTGNCFECHRIAPHDRLFGIPRSDVYYRNPSVDISGKSVLKPRDQSATTP